MKRYLLRRLTTSIFVLLGITLISFAVIHCAPGKPGILESELNAKISAQAREKLLTLYGLDKPLYAQYTQWLGRLLRFDFGDSFVDAEPVTTKIATHLPITLFINILSLGIILIFGTFLGVLSALRRGKAFDYAVTVFVFIGFALPSFWVALLAMSLFGVQLRMLPVAGIISYGFQTLSPLGKIADVARHLALPVTIASIGGLAGISRYIKSSFLGVLEQDYIRTAYAKGLPRARVLYRHALKNALLPIVTLLGLSVPGLIGGSVIFESIFSIPGMGKLFFDSVMARDYPVIMAILFLSAVLTLLGNMLADISYAVIDPRIRYGKR